MLLITSPKCFTNLRSATSDSYHFLLERYQKMVDFRLKASILGWLPGTIVNSIPASWHRWAHDMMRPHMERHGTSCDPWRGRSWLVRLRNMGVPAESRQAWFLGWHLWDGIMGQLAGAWFHGVLLIMLIIHSWHGEYPHDLQGFIHPTGGCLGVLPSPAIHGVFFPPNK